MRTPRATIGGYLSTPDLVHPRTAQIVTGADFVPDLAVQSEMMSASM